MWPWGQESRSREIGRCYIKKVGAGCARGDYEAAVCRRGVSACPWLHGDDDATDKRRPTPVRTGDVKNYPRLSYNVWRLVIRSLRACFPEEK